MQLASVPQAEKTERLQWVHDMRAAFSPAAMLTDDGDIRQEFFKPKKVLSAEVLDYLYSSNLCKELVWLSLVGNFLCSMADLTNVCTGCSGG